MKYKLDLAQAKFYVLSNDAFFYLLEDEEPLDEANLVEAEELLQQYPYGFQISKGWEPIENSGLISCEIVPYIEDLQEPFDFDEYHELFKGWQLQIKYLSPEVVRVWDYNMNTRTQTLIGDCKIRTGPSRLKYFHTGDQSKDFIPGKSCLFFLKHFNKRSPE